MISLFLRRNPLLLPVGCYMLALAVGFAIDVQWWRWVTLALLAAAVAFLLLRSIAGTVTACILAAGWTVASLSPGQEDVAPLLGIERVWSGTVSHLRSTDTSQIADILIDSVANAGSRRFAATGPFRVQTTVVGFYPELTNTSRVTWKGELDALRQDVLPGMDDRSASQRRRGVCAVAIVRASQVSVAEEPGMLNDIRRLRNRLSMLLLKSGFDENATELLHALLLGDNEFLTQDMRDRYSAAGLAHILALSGMHVAVLAAIVTLLLWPLRLRARRLPLLLTMAVLWMYAILTGMSPSVVRAVIMASAYSIGMLLQRRPAPLNSLALAALLILLVEPHALMSDGFILSFSAVLAIILFSSPFNFAGIRSSTLVKQAGSIISVSLAAVLGSGVAAAYIFHRFPLYFMLSAFVASLLLPVMVSAAIVQMLLTGAGYSWRTAVDIADLCARILEATANMVSSLPGAVAEGIWLQPEVLVLIIGALLALALMLSQNRKLSALRDMRPFWGLVSLMLAATAVATQLITYRPPSRQEMVLLMPDHQHASMLVVQDDKAWVFSDGHAADSTRLFEMVRSNFADLMSRQRISTDRLGRRDVACHSSAGRCIAIWPERGDVIVLPPTVKSSDIDRLDSGGSMIVVTPGVRKRVIARLDTLRMPYLRYIPFANSQKEAHPTGHASCVR